VYEAITGTWDEPGQVEVGTAVGHHGLPVLARSFIETAFAQGGQFPGIRDFRGLRFRYGRARPPILRTEPVFRDAMPVLF
jgi:hypothetical protein